MVKNKKIIQADKVINFQVSIPASIPDGLAVDYARMEFVMQNFKWATDIIGKHLSSQEEKQFAGGMPEKDKRL